jgi:hypothetical protein
MWTGCSLSDAACDALFCAACDCALGKKSEKRVKNDDVEGIVYTEFEHGVTGDIAGIAFYGDIATEEGDTKVKFLVTANDLEAARHDTEARWYRLKDLEKEIRDSAQWN